MFVPNTENISIKAYFSLFNISHKTQNRLWQNLNIFLFSNLPQFLFLPFSCKLSNAYSQL